MWSLLSVVSIIIQNSSFKIGALFPAAAALESADQHQAPPYSHSHFKSISVWSHQVLRPLDLPKSEMEPPFHKGKDPVLVVPRRSHEGDGTRTEPSRMGAETGDRGRNTKGRAMKAARASFHLKHTPLLSVWYFLMPWRFSCICTTLHLQSRKQHFPGNSRDRSGLNWPQSSFIDLKLKITHLSSSSHLLLLPIRGPWGTIQLP